MIALFDGDILVFRCGFAAEKAQWFLSIGGEEPEIFAYKKEADLRLDEVLPNVRSRTSKDYQLWSERYVEPLGNALNNLKMLVRKIQRETQTSDYDSKFFLSGPTNFRKEVAVTKPYKGSRDDAHRPTHEQAIRDFISRTWDTTVSEGEEADDLLGIYQCRIGPDESVIVTADKDLNMIPGFKYNFLHEEKLYITEEQAMTCFYKQLLTGDSVDDIPGLQRVGARTAEKLLDGKSLEDQWQTVVSEYMRRGPANWDEYLREQGQLLWIRRKPGEMWEPNLEEVPEWNNPELSLL